MRCIDANALERDGWTLHRTYQKDAITMVYETKRIEDVPTIQPQPHWIPCSERLPEFGEPVLFSVCGPSYVATGCLAAAGVWHEYRFGMDLGKERVAAWMPLPEPYREEGEE